MSSSTRSKSFIQHKQRLEAQKSKISTLVQDIEQHEQERDEAAHHHAGFTDPKYATGYRYNPTWDDDNDKESISSSQSPESEISKMLGSDSDKKKKAKGKKTRRQSVSKPPTRGASAKSRSPITKKSGRNVKSKTNVSGSPAAESITSLRTSADLVKQVESVHVKIDFDDDEDEEEGFLHIIEALHCFENLKYVFMQRLLDYSEVEATGVFKADKVDLAHQILNVEGQLLFLMQQTKLKCTAFIAYAKKAFENILYDVYGNKVLKYIGPSVFMSKMTSRMLVTDAHDRILGYIKAFGNKVNYSVYNAIGERLFLVVSNLYIPTTTTDFTILCRGQKIGVIKYGWKHVFHDLNYIDYETSGIEFPAEMDEREKALLLGCLMLIEFFWYSPLTRLKLSLLFIGILLFTLAIVILCVPIIIDNPYDDTKTKSFYVAERLKKLREADGKDIPDLGG